MRLLLKVLAILIFGPLVLGLIFILAIVALIGAPLLWERITQRFTSPPDQQQT